MGRYPKVQVVQQKKKGGWSKDEDQKLAKFIKDDGVQGLNWETISEKAGLNRSGKSCRLRWKNYLSPHIRRGNFSHEEESIIIHLQSLLGNKWSQIAAKLPGRTDNDIKNLWNTKLRKQLPSKATTEYSSQSQTPSTDHKFLANYLMILINVFSYNTLLGFLNMPQLPEIAQNLLLLQELEIKQQEMVMAPTPNYGFGNELDAISFEGGLSAVCSNYDLSECDHMLPPLVSASNLEIPTPMIDEFCVNPNSVEGSFEYDQWMANEMMNYQFPHHLDSAMQDNASSSITYDGASCSFNDYFQN